ncbi:MAG: GNAT family N-acetyltransferase [Acidimicrobiia bacterium]
MTTEVRHAPNRSRYEIYVDDVLAGIADYHDGDDASAARVFPHTEIDATRRGMGLAAVLVGQALDDTRSTGRRVVPACWYVKQYIDEHPEYIDMLATE